MRVPVYPHLTSGLLGGLLKPWDSTYRMQVWNGKVEERLKGNGERIIYVFWHNRLLPLITYYRRAYVPRFPGDRVDVLVSRSKTGELMSRILHRFRFGTVRGSSSRGGREAMLEMARRLRSGKDVAIIPDGPRGPRYVAKMGAVALARVSGSPILPVGVSAKPTVRFNSWDRFMLPIPFARIGIYFGEPLYVFKDDDLEEARLRLERVLMDVTRRVDEKLGVGIDY